MIEPLDWLVHTQTAGAARQADTAANVTSEILMINGMFSLEFVKRADQWGLAVGRNNNLLVITSSGLAQNRKNRSLWQWPRR